MKQLSLFDQLEFEPAEAELPTIPTPQQASGYKEVLGVRYSLGPVEGWCEAERFEIMVEGVVREPFVEGVVWVDPHTLIRANPGGTPPVYWGQGEWGYVSQVMVDGKRTFVSLPDEELSSGVMRGQMWIKFTDAQSYQLARQAVEEYWRKLREARRAKYGH